jgi:hypothetical protein
MRRLAGLPAEQDTVVVVVWAKVAPLLVDHLDVSLEHRERERVERRRVLSILGLAV